MPPVRRKVAVVGCRNGGLAIALALADPDYVVAGFDTVSSGAATTLSSCAPASAAIAGAIASCSLALRH